MIYYIQEIPHETQNRGAWGKAHGDINSILCSLNYSPLCIKQETHSGINRYVRQIKGLKQWEDALSDLRKRDTLFLQYPPLENSFFLMRLFKNLSNKGVKIATIIHDFIPLTVAPAYKKILYLKEDHDILKLSSYIIAHNEKMVDYIDKTYGCGDKTISLGIFDYCMDSFDYNLASQRQIGRKEPVIISGTLNPHFSGKYLDELPDNLEFNLFGNGYIDQGKSNIHYYGSFDPTELPYKFRGSFGLVWYGDRSDTCSGKIKNYLKIINPHRTSSYLAAGIPVICWKEMGIADFILRNNCGFVVDSLYDIADTIQNMSDAVYNCMKKNAEQVGAKLRNGEFLKNAVSKIM